MFPSWVYDVWRRFFGRYVIVDPQPIAVSAPYTFFLPPQRDLQRIKPGDLVKLMFESVPRSVEWDAERMWVTVKSVGEVEMRGVLETSPSDMPQLKPGAAVTFQRHHIIDVIWKNGEGTETSVAEPRSYWERCLVDDCVLNEGVPVGYVYREEPDMAEADDTYPDSGWRIRGDWRGVSDEEIDARKLSYVALGAVLNCDDSWLHLIDQPIGAAYLKDFSTGEFQPETR